MNKNILKKATLFFVIAGSLALLGYEGHKKWTLTQAVEKNQRRIVSYDQQIVPLYKKKAVIVQKFLTARKFQSKDVAGLLTHIPHWKVRNEQDLKEVEELSQTLDTKLSEAILASRPAVKKGPELALKELQEVEKEIRTERSTLGLQ